MYDVDTNLDLDQVMDNINVADMLSSGELASLAENVVKGYDLDKRSRQGWEDKVEEWTKLALQVTEEKSTPWIGAANVKYPLITNAALQYNARAYPALITGPNVVRGRVIGFDEDGSKLDRARELGVQELSEQQLRELLESG